MSVSNFSLRNICYVKYEESCIRVPMYYDVKTMLNKAREGFVAFPTIISFFSSFQMQFAVVTLERRLTFKMNIALLTMVLII